MAAVFDTLKFSQRAQESDFTKQQADFLAEELSSTLNDTLATKIDLHTELKLLEQRLIIKCGIMMLGCSTLIITILKF